MNMNITKTYIIEPFACLVGADLRGERLRGLNLRFANLAHANLSGADLTNADLTGANLIGAVLTGAALFGARYSAADQRRFKVPGWVVCLGRLKPEITTLSSVLFG